MYVPEGAAVPTLSLRGLKGRGNLREVVSVKRRLVRKPGSLRLPRRFAPRNDRVDRLHPKQPSPLRVEAPQEGVLGFALDAAAAGDAADGRGGLFCCPGLAV